MSTPEARAAAAYWEAWAPLPIHFVRADVRKVPEHWMTFGPRRSPISGSPRLAANPGNAVLNYLYRLLEAETRLAILAVGLDPGLGFFHKDKRGRDNLVMDVMEACRPQVDAYAMQLFQVQLFRAADFHETRKGVCRMLPPLTHQFAETTLSWARAVGPVPEAVARMLGKPRRVREDRPPTPLTGDNRSSARRGLRGQPNPTAQQEAAGLLPKACRLCGQVLEFRTRKYCDSCLASHSGSDTALLKRAVAMVRHQEEIAKWWRIGRAASDFMFAQKVLPELRHVPIQAMIRATGLSEAYCYRIRRGDAIPHPRHWQTLQELVGDGPNTP